MNSWLINNGIAAWLLPPGCIVLLGAFAVWRWRKHPHSAKVLMSLLLAALWMLSTPWFAHVLLHSIEPAVTDPLHVAAVCSSWI